MSPVRRAAEPEQDLVVAERQPVVRRELRAEAPRRGGVCPYQRGERSRQKFARSILDCSLFFLYIACVLNSSGRKGECHVHPCRVFGHRHPERNVVDRPRLVGARVRGQEARARPIKGRVPGFSGTIEGGDDASIDGRRRRRRTITTFDETRDGHLQSPDFFDTERYPELRFESTAVETARRRARRRRRADDQGTSRSRSS